MAISDYVISAMCGNFAVESTMNPAVWESLIPSTFDHEYQYDAIGGYGLGQWTNVGTKYGRLWNLHTWVTANGYADGDGNGQLEFIVAENVWEVKPDMRGTYSTLTEFLNSDSTSLEDLTYDWLRCWEGIGTGTYNDRLDYAREFYDYIQQHKNDSPTSYSWISSNQYLSLAQMKNNAMCVYFNFTSPTPRPVKRKGLPIWMMIRKRY